MKCQKCNNKLEDYGNEELVCSNCGACYYLEFQGAYIGDKQEMVGENFLPKEWTEKWI